MATKVRTIPVRVNIYTGDYIISGLAHPKFGAYKDRVSDVINDPGTRFLVLTDATFRPLADEKGAAKRCATLLVRIDEIRLLVPFEETGSAVVAPPEVGSAP